MLTIKQIFNLTYYTSELDEFLSEFDQFHGNLSESQQKEQNKYARIYELRDNPHAPVKKTSFWEKF